MEPSLDISQLVRPLDDRDPQALFDEWLTSMRTIDPTYTPMTGAVETSAAEAMCLTVADLIYAVNRLPGLVTEAVLALTDVPRHPGTPATGQVQLTFDGTRTVSIPAGTRMAIDGLEWQTTTPVTVTGATATITVTSVEPSGLGNAIPPGVGVDLLDRIPAVVAAVTTGTFGGGISPESDASYQARAGLIFARSHAALVLPSAFASWAAGLIDVGRANAVDCWDAPGSAAPGGGGEWETSGVPGEDAGHITVVVYGYDRPIDTVRLADIAADIDARSCSNLVVHTLPANIVDIDADVVVRLEPGASETDTLAAVEAAIRSAVSPMLWTWGETVTSDELKAIAARVSGVDYATATPGFTDVALSPQDLPRAATITVTAAP